MQYFMNSDAGVVVLNIVDILEKSKDYLSDIDGAIGDGDHGINMSKGAGLARQRLVGSHASMSDALKVMSDVMLMEIGGAMGPLYGTIFRSMYLVSRARERVDALVVREMLETGLADVKALGMAAVGDKTLVDALEPAANAFASATDQGQSFYDALTAMRVAAERGKESTRDMVAKLGRASRLGDRSKGVLDAGATSACLILSAIADSMQALLGESHLSVDSDAVA